MPFTPEDEKKSFPLEFRVCLYYSIMRPDYPYHNIKIGDESNNNLLDNNLLTIFGAHTCKTNYREGLTSRS